MATFAAEETALLSRLKSARERARAADEALGDAQTTYASLIAAQVLYHSTYGAGTDTETLDSVTIASGDDATAAASTAAPPPAVDVPALEAVSAPPSSVARRGLVAGDDEDAFFGNASDDAKASPRCAPPSDAKDAKDDAKAVARPTSSDAKADDGDFFKASPRRPDDGDSRAAPVPLSLAIDVFDASSRCPPSSTARGETAADDDDAATCVEELDIPAASPRSPRPEVCDEEIEGDHRGAAAPTTKRGGFLDDDASGFGGGDDASGFGGGDDASGFGGGDDASGFGGGDDASGFGGAPPTAASRRGGFLDDDASDFGFGGGGGASARSPAGFGLGSAAASPAVAISSPARGAAVTAAEKTLAARIARIEAAEKAAAPTPSPKKKPRRTTAEPVRQSKSSEGGAPPGRERLSRQRPARAPPAAAAAAVARRALPRKAAATGMPGDDAGPRTTSADRLRNKITSRRLKGAGAAKAAGAALDKLLDDDADAAAPHRRAQRAALARAPRR